MVAANTSAIDPVPRPISTPQQSTSCQPVVTNTVRPLPSATSTRAEQVIRRMPKRSISAAANGAVRPYRIRLTPTATDSSPRDQPNSSCNGIISTPGRRPEAGRADQGDKSDPGDDPGRVQPAASRTTAGGGHNW